jgi:hypothetical protein
MVGGTASDLMTATFFRENTATLANRSASESRAALFPANTDTIMCTRAARSSGTCWVLITATWDTTNDGVNDPVPRSGPPAGQNGGVVHAIVGSTTATPAPVATAAESAAVMMRSPQVAAIETLERGSRSWSHQG